MFIFSVDLNNLNTFQQAVLYVAPIFTSSVWTNSVLVWVRLRYFEWRFEGIYKKSDMNLKARIKTMSFNKEKMNFVQRSVTFFGSSNQGKKHTSNPDNGPISNSTSSNVPEGKVVFSNFFSRHHPDNLNKYQETNLQSEDMLENEGPKDMLEDSKESKPAKRFLSNLKHILPWVKSNNIYNTISTYLDWEPQVKGNSVFIELDTQRKEELGGIEYKALRLLRKILLIYYYGFIIISGFLFAPWASMTKEYASVFETYSLNKIWWGIFLGQSAFNNVGFSLNPDSVIPFANNRFIVVMLAFIMIIGYSGFPCMLRLIIWGMSRCTGVNRDIHVTLTFLLEHPRRCFTLLFPSSTTWILFGIILMLNSIDLVLFIVLGLKNPVFESLNWNHRITTGIFQSAATRTSGLSVLNLADLHPGVQVLYAIMMYISVFPIAMSLRNTNVYEEKSLGIFLDDSSSSCSESENEENQNSENFGTSETAPKRNNSSAKSSKIPNLGAPSKPTVWGAHIQQQLSFDMWFLFIVFLLLCITESGKLAYGYNHLVGYEGGIPTKENYKIPIPLFNIMFEVVSAYCTVGLSLGYPNTNTSLSAQFSVVGKLIICACFYRGRHRGLPYAVDRAVLLPSDLEKSDKDQEKRVMGHSRKAKTFSTGVNTNSLGKNGGATKKRQTNT